MALQELIYFGWAMALGSSMNARLPAPLRRGSLLPAAGLAIATGYALWFGSQFASPGGLGSFGCLQWALHLLSMAVNFYLLWFVSRALVAAEVGGQPPLGRALVLCSVLWFSILLPIGPWWAQERARAIGDTSSGT